MICKWCGKETIDSFCNQEHKENSEVFSILEAITDELDLVFKATSYPWKVELTDKSYDILKNRPGTHWALDVNANTYAYLPRSLIYEKDGCEYLKCLENHNIPFIIHARIANKNARFDSLVLDDLNRPNIVEEHRLDFYKNT